MKDNIIIKTSSDISEITILIPEESCLIKQEALALAGTCVAVTSPAEQAAAVSAVAVLRKILKAVEAMRKEILKPFRAKVEEINQKAKDFSEALEAEDKRLTKSLTDYQRAQDEEAARIRREETERIRKAQEEAARLAKEEADKLAAQAEKARSAMLREALATQAKESAVAAETIAITAEATAKAGASAMVSATIAKPTGASVNRPWTFEVIDLPALYAARPDLCRLEENKSAILAELRSGVREIPGIKIFQETKVAVRAA